MTPGERHVRTPRRPGGRFAALPAAAVLALLMALPAVTRAAAPALVWLAPMRGGVAALAADGTVVLFPDGVPGGPAAAPVPLERNVQGDSLLVCDGHLYAVAAGNELETVGTGRHGPQVSPHSRPACLPDGRVAAIDERAQSVLLLEPDMSLTARAELDALPDADPVVLEGGRVAILAAPTQSYRHGILGDEVEAAAVAILSGSDLHEVARYEVQPPAVVEQRRVLPFPPAGRDGMLLTISTPTEGARVVAVGETAAGMVTLAAGPPMGAAHRWLNLFAAAGSGGAARAYAVATPHLRGPLQRYAWDAGGLEPTPFDLGVTNHALGSRNLDFGVLVPRPEGAPAPAAGAPVDLLALPSVDLETVVLIACGRDACAVARRVPLGAPLTSNLAAVAAAGRTVLYAGDRRGGLHRIELQPSLWAPPAGPPSSAGAAAGGRTGPPAGGAR